MLGLKDFFRMPQIDGLVDQLVRDAPGLVVVAGMESRHVPGEDESAHWLLSGKTTILRILMQEILTVHERANCVVFPQSGVAFRVPRGLRLRCDVIQPRQPELRLRQLQSAINRRPGLLVIEHLDAETAPLAISAAQNGTRVLAQVNTLFRGSAVARYLQTFNLTREQLNQLTWVISVMRQPVLCADCKQPIDGKPEVLEKLGLSGSQGPIQLYRAVGCSQCKHTGRQGEVTVFDIFRADHNRPDLFVQPSLLPEREYLLYLVRDGQLSPEDPADFDANLLSDTYALLEAEEKALVEANHALQRKVLELEVSNRLIVQRTEALISLQEIGQTLIHSNSLSDLAQRLCRFTREQCGAERSAVYFNRSLDELEVVAHTGWELARVEGYVPTGLFPVLPSSEEMRLFRRFPPGLGLSEATTTDARTGYYIPLVVDGQPVGAMIVQTTRKNSFTPGEVSMLRMFANQAALAMQRAGLIDQLRAKIEALEAAQAVLLQKERLDHELELARQVQQSLLPRKFPEIHGVEFAARNRPAHQVGGDFYDVVRLDENRFGLVIADVSDKGMPAALYMALARSLILAEAHREGSPRRVLFNVNRLLMELGEPGMFVTVFYGVVDHATRKLVYARAGHDLPVVLRGDQMMRLAGDGMALGAFGDEHFHLDEQNLTLQQDDRLVLFTDGLVDALSPQGEGFGHARLDELWRGLSNSDAAQLCDVTFEHLGAFQGGVEQTDDMTLLAVQFNAWPE